MASNTSAHGDAVYEKNIPVMGMLSVFVVIGIVGNSVVLYIYGTRFKVSTTRVFILSLALFDLITCVLLPYKIVLLRYASLFTNPHLARLEMVRIYFLQVSFMILPLVSVDRYRRICWPFKKQISPRFAKTLILVECVMMTTMTIFRMVLSSAQTNYKAEAFISPKYISKIFSGTSISAFYFAYTIIPFCLPLPVLMIMYFLIAVRVRKLINRESSTSLSGIPIPRGEETPLDEMIRDIDINTLDTKTGGASGASLSVDAASFSAEVVDGSGVDMTPGFRTNVDENKISFNGGEMSPMPDNKLNTITARKHGTYIDCCLDDDGVPEVEPSRVGKEFRRMTVNPDMHGNRKFDTSQRWKRMTLIFFLIAVVYIVCVVPAIVLFAIVHGNISYGVSLMSRPIFIILYSLPYFTNISNCFLYSFFDPRFRQELKSVNISFISCYQK